LGLILFFLEFLSAGKLFTQRVFAFPESSKTTVNAKLTIASDLAKNSREQTILAALADPGDSFTALKRENKLTAGSASTTAAGACESISFLISISPCYLY
jgi:hypothetical protein